MVTVNNSKFNAAPGGPEASFRMNCEFKGLSTDDKPTACGVNSLFLELDTGEFYYFDGEDWAKVGA